MTATAQTGMNVAELKGARAVQRKTQLRKKRAEYYRSASISCEPDLLPKNVRPPACEQRACSRRKSVPKSHGATRAATRTVLNNKSVMNAEWYVSESKFDAVFSDLDKAETTVPEDSSTEASSDSANATPAMTFKENVQSEESLCASPLDLHEHDNAQWLNDPVNVAQRLPLRLYDESKWIDYVNERTNLEQEESKWIEFAHDITKSRYGPSRDVRHANHTHEKNAESTWVDYDKSRWVDHSKDSWGDQAKNCSTQSYGKSRWIARFREESKWDKLNMNKTQNDESRWNDPHENVPQCVGSAWVDHINDRTKSNYDDSAWVDHSRHNKFEAKWREPSHTVTYNACNWIDFANDEATRGPARSRPSSKSHYDDSKWINYESDATTPGSDHEESQWIGHSNDLHGKSSSSNESEYDESKWIDYPNAAVNRAVNPVYNESRPSIESKYDKSKWVDYPTVATDPVYDKTTLMKHLTSITQVHHRWPIHCVSSARLTTGNDEHQSVETFCPSAQSENNESKWIENPNEAVKKIWAEAEAYARKWEEALNQAEQAEEDLVTDHAVMESDEPRDMTLPVIDGDWTLLGTKDEGGMSMTCDSEYYLL
eukprot:gnl/MRDRNA2_/MRDRNA2_123907_c0_seq1.p1 gnl/MRDRNA2_/MRDRNA2_123907_c0~~gnl/MRDRNA2_/MRDRNA2_123907_c0_seq1.p1  ORF type:complete len:630 (+),score=95.78 gnl/MRDRNA2_/MRDRNA2_123907_c0_seq1:95-1891(+)